jgi:tellurite resistance protein TehA-like permease
VPFLGVTMEFIGSGKDVVKKIQLVAAGGLSTELPSSSSSRGEGDALPALLVKAPSQTVAGFDCVGADDVAVSLHEMDDKVEELQGRPGSNKDTAIRAYDDAHVVPYSVSLSMPASPSGFHLSQFVPVAPTDHVHPEPTARSPRLVKQTRFHSQPIVLNMNLHPSSSTNKNVDEGEARRWDSARDKRFDPFKTFSGRLERQLSNLRGRPQDPVDGVSSSPDSEEETDQVPAADRYFDALEGPELDTLRVSKASGKRARSCFHSQLSLNLTTTLLASTFVCLHCMQATEVPVLPKDEKWPFLLRFPISAFGMCLGVSSQAILWKTLASAPPTAFLRVSPAVSHALWYVALALTALVSAMYLLKVVFYLEAVRREFYHPVRANFFFAPWIACLFLALGAPRLVVAEMHRGVWYALMAPILCLELKIYGQWMSGGQRRLSKVANPSNHLSVVGNFVGALLGARMGLREGPVFFFAVGLAHYLVLFVTLYQRLPTNVTLPKELHPVFFLFVAAPSVASMAWAKINGQFDNGARIAYFIALFLYMSLVRTYVRTYSW